MKLLVTGANGMIGSALVPFLRERGHETQPLTRHGGDDAARWDPGDGKMDAGVLEGVDGVVHLAGSNIAAGRWTAARKAEILGSRVQPTRLLVETMARLERRPGVLLCSSAIGYYGDTGDFLVAEESPAGEGFLPDVCRQWEAEAMRATDLGVRVVVMRTGVVLSGSGGALGKMLPIFRAGLGGPIGGGKQWMSWITIDDLLRVIEFALGNDGIRGPLNAVSPSPVTNSEFVHTLGHVLGRPSVAPVPATMLKAMYGAMATETILASARVESRRLNESEFEFLQPDLEPALRRVLGKE